MYSCGCGYYSCQSCVSALAHQLLKLVPLFLLVPHVFLPLSELFTPQPLQLAAHHCPSSYKQEGLFSNCLQMDVVSRSGGSSGVEAREEADTFGINLEASAVEVRVQLKCHQQCRTASSPPFFSVSISCMAQCNNCSLSAQGWSAIPAGQLAAHTCMHDGTVYITCECFNIGLGRLPLVVLCVGCALQLVWLLWGLPITVAILSMCAGTAVGPCAAVIILEPVIAGFRNHVWEEGGDLFII